MHQETWCNGSIGGSNPSGQRSSRCVFAKKSRVDVIGNMPDSESGLKSSSLLLAAMRIGVVGNTRAFDSRVEIYGFESLILSQINIIFQKTRASVLVFASILTTNFRKGKELC